MRRSRLLLGLILTTWSPLAFAQEAGIDLPVLPAPTDATEIEKADRPKPVAENESEPVPSRFGENPADEAYGAFQRGLYITAHNLALPRAMAGDSAAQTLLGEIYSRGLGVPRDPDKAREWYEKAAKLGEPEAQLQYGLELLRTGGPEVRAEAKKMMAASAQAGNAKAQFNMAQIILEEKPGFSGLQEALPFFEKAARAGVADAQYALAQYYAAGSGGVLPDAVKAREWLMKAARQNYDTAQLELGDYLLRGIGGERDLKAGFGWMLAAAMQGNIAASGEVAKLYWGGIGTEPDSAKAASWYVLARRDGLRDKVLEDFWEGLSREVQRQAIEQANRLR